MSPIPMLSSPFFFMLPQLVHPCRHSWGLNPQILLQDLMADLKSELSGSLAKLILGLMLTPAQYDAKQLRKAVEVIVILLGAWGCQCPQLHMPQGLMSYGEEKIRKHQDKDLVCTQDLPLQPSMLRQLAATGEPG